ncbi:MAG TPA: T9SS type A sorting domain-containing protein [Caldithrix abyssi]|uniref:T9SS type A sorting domain-containing protein n=1 Tax=Caldithrix abyssi TaxID=187145 RepID=A0A7V4U0J3_CALAY|nr:T9SS type A sorting domain-containing protein [Caldithrix abyssi]
MKKFYIIPVIWILSFCAQLLADGLMLPNEDNYPKELLRNRMTHVTVNINGLVAETYVYQEFVNESNDTTDAVYSFPLPPDARATDFVYWYEGKVYRAVLKVKEQAVNPGTGEGGIAAEVNSYIGRNGIKIFLKNIKAGQIQKVRLRYISLCDYYQGKLTYTYPLNTEKFVTYPLDHLQFTFSVTSNSDILEFDIPTHPDYRVINNDGRSLKIEMEQPKAYVNRDLVFTCQLTQDELGVDFYSVNNDSTDGHFALFVRPQNEAPADSVLPRRVLCLLSTASDMYGYKLEQSIIAIKDILNMLGDRDQFNILLFDHQTTAWKEAPVQASPENIQQAEDFLDAVSIGYGSDLGNALQTALDQITDASYSNAILVFSGGTTSIDPRQIESQNTYRSGIFPISIGTSGGLARLEMTAALNYGFVTYVQGTEYIRQKMVRVFEQISQPVLDDVRLEYGKADLSQLIPEKIPNVYAGSYLFTAGRYAESGESALSIAGYSARGPVVYDFRLEFSDSTNPYKFAESLWAKEMIDALEREIEIYGETDELKARLIDLSLTYNIRCRYTAFIADYENEATPIDRTLPQLKPQSSFLAGNYPNPFNPLTRIRVYISPEADHAVKLIKIYNILGQLVAVIDISHLTSGWHEVLFDALNFWGGRLSSGMYIVQLQIGNNIRNAIRINLVK